MLALGWMIKQPLVGGQREMFSRLDAKRMEVKKNIHDESLSS